jgi:OmpA-OmpF porin, OOP family
LPGSKDHPLLKRFGGSPVVGSGASNFRIVDLQTSAFTSFDLSTSKRVYAKPALRVEGKVTRLWYEAPGTTTSTEFYRNYTNELAASGFTALYDSTNDAQATRRSNFLAPFSSQGGDGLKTNRSSYVLYSARTGSIRTGTFRKDNVFVRLFTIDWSEDDRTFKAKQGAYAAVDLIETKVMAQNMVVVSASEMSKAIANTGKIAIYGMLFDTGKADVKAEPKPSLDQIALFLKGVPPHGLT